MCTNQYQLLKFDLFEDQRQFERNIDAIYQKQNRRRAELNYRMEIGSLVAMNAENERCYKMGYVLMRLGIKIMNQKQLFFERARGSYLKQMHETQTNKRRSCQLKKVIAITSVLEDCLKSNKRYLFDTLKQAANRENNLEIRFDRLQRKICLKLLVNGFQRLRENQYQKVINQQNDYAEKLKQQLKESKQLTSTKKQMQQSISNLNQLTNRLKQKDEYILKLQKQLKSQKENYEDQVEELQDELNRLNLENIKLKANQQRQYRVGGIGCMSKDLTLNGSVDLSLRILDQIQFGEKEGKTEEEKKKATEEELSEKYFRKIVELKQIIQSATQYIEQKGISTGGLDSQQLEEVLKLLESR